MQLMHLMVLDLEEYQAAWSKSYTGWVKPHVQDVVLVKNFFL